MPDDAAALVAGLILGNALRQLLRAGRAGLQARHSLVDGAELLVARYDFDGLAVDLGEAGEVAHNIQQVRWIQYPGDQGLLAGKTLHAQVGGDLGRIEGMGILPFLVMAIVRADGTQARRLEASGDQELGVTEELLRPFRLADPSWVGAGASWVGAGPLALIAVAQELCDGMGERVLAVGALGLHDDQGNAVDEEYQVGDDVIAARRGPDRIDAELVDDEEVVALRVLEVEVMHGDVLAAAWPFHLRPLEQQVGGSLVGLDEVGLAQPLQAIDGLIDTRLI